MTEDQRFYVGQKAFIEKNGEVLILFDLKNRLDLPGGKIQEGETDFKKSLTREVKEETNLEIEIGVPFIVWYYELPRDHRNAGEKLYLVGFKCTYVSGTVRISKDLREFRWVDKNNYREFAQGKEYFPALEKYFEL